MTTRIGNWFDDRLGWRHVWEAIFKRKVPKVNWLYTLGSATLFVALNQMITGILLCLFSKSFVILEHFGNFEETFEKSAIISTILSMMALPNKLCFSHFTA